jgi:peptidoglycan/xylan/chitin deacetylase (PgdA/CDA1 family)
LIVQYPYVPMPQRGRLVWPGGARLAVILTINLEHWDLLREDAAPNYAGGPAILPDMLPGNVADFPNYSWREYGQRVGLWRMLRELDAAGVPASCTMNAVTGLRRRAMIDAILERGWELVAHNYEQGELLTRYAHDPEGERRVIHATLEVFERVTGRRARGWLSSSLRGTPRTPEILAEYGALFFCDLMNDDQPYLISTPKGRIVATPYSIEVNDFTFFQRRGLTNADAVTLLCEQFDVLYEEGAQTGMVMNIGLHPHVSGVPHRIRALRAFLDYAGRRADVWWPTREQLAEHYLTVHASHIPDGAA